MSLNRSLKRAAAAWFYWYRGAYYGKYKRECDISCKSGFWPWFHVIWIKLLARWENNNICYKSKEVGHRDDKMWPHPSISVTGLGFVKILSWEEKTNKVIEILHQVKKGLYFETKRPMINNWPFWHKSYVNFSVKIAVFRWKRPEERKTEILTFEEKHKNLDDLWKENKFSSFSYGHFCVCFKTPLRCVYKYIF